MTSDGWHRGRLFPIRDRHLRCPQSKSRWGVSPCAARWDPVSAPTRDEWQLSGSAIDYAADRSESAAEPKFSE
jgi:hypothetical protein